MSKLGRKIFALVDILFGKQDKQFILRSRNIQNIPDLRQRRGGKVSYAEWAHVIGIFQTVIYGILESKTSNKVLDIGCGTGLMAIATSNFIEDGGQYTGIDVIKKDIEFDKGHYDNNLYKFIHFDLANPSYAKQQSTEKTPWPVADNTYDLVTALSVWTHLKEDDAVYYFKEIKRVLKPGAKALITFFILDDEYERSLERRTNSEGKYHKTSQMKWIFDASAYGSKDWMTPIWVKHPEDAIGVTKKGLDQLLSTSGLELKHHYQGNWKELPGLYFQDVLILEG